MEKENNCKRGLLTGKSYVVANAIIRANKQENRRIVDETDVENLEFMILNKLNYMGISAKFIDDLNTDIINGEMLCISDGEGKLFMLLPDIDIEEFEKEYRERIVLNDLAQAFSSLDDNEALLRNSRELKRLKRREKLLTEFCSNEEIKPVKEERPKQYHKISEK